MGAKSGVDAMAKTFPMALKTIEDVAAEFTPLRIQGTHMACLDPEMQDLIKYAIIDCGFVGITTTPTQRLIFTLLTTAARQHAINTAFESMTPEQKQECEKAIRAANPPPQNKKAAADDKYAELINKSLFFS